MRPHFSYFCFMNDSQFELLFREQFTPLCNLAFTLVKDEDSAKDIVQQVFLRLWQMRSDLKIRSSVRSYLYRAVVNTALNKIKSEKQFVSLEGKATESIADTDNTEYHTYRDHIENKVRLAINTLPPVCRTVFSLSRFSDLTNKEIAAELKISVKAVEKHISKAFKILREELKSIRLTELMFWIFVLYGVYSLNFEVGFLTIILSY